MHGLMQWLSMGGYASYVWSAYGVVSVVFLLNAVGCRWQKNRIETALKTWFKQTSR
jgi:heme exporter protein D